MDTALTPVHDRQAWDSFVATAPYGHILQSWEWGEIKAQSGWQATRLGLCNGGALRAGAQVLLRPLPYGFGRLAYVPKGPVVDYRDPAQVRAVARGLARYADEQRAISLKLEPEVLGPSSVGEELEKLGLRPATPVQMRSSIWVDLTASEEEILGRMKQKTRYNIRLAGRRGVTVSEGSLEELAEWYEMYRATARRDGFSIHEASYYQAVLCALQPRGMATLLLARHEGDLLAGIVVFCFGHLAQYMYGASSACKRNLMAPYLVQWEGMRWARGRGAATYDLWGIPDQLEEGEELWGVYRHKRGYGGEVVRYIGAYDLVREPLQHLALERVARPLLKRVARMGV
jgi:lipid II:glycine glycyltransferase (peptidoglycan interpeptide bridge formation enzyme)